MKPTPSTKLTRHEMRALSWAVREAELWRGSQTGNPDPAPLAAFDASIKLAKSALKKVRSADNETR